MRKRHVKKWMKKAGMNYPSRRVNVSASIISVGTFSIESLGIPAKPWEDAWKENRGTPLKDMMEIIESAKKYSYPIG